MITILVTALEYDKASEVFLSAAQRGWACVRAPADERTLSRMVREHAARHAILGVDRYSGRLYEALPPGGVVARFGVGHDGIDKAAATARGLFCTNTPGVLEDSVAEFAIALILAAARHVPVVAASTGRGDWTPLTGLELRGKTLAVIGCGAIGRRVAQIAARGLGMRVEGCETAEVDTDRLARQYGFSAVHGDFAAAVPGADFVSLHIPSTVATRHFINRERLARLPARAWLINTARGAIVDEGALYEALSGGRIAGAALDVFEREPYQPLNPDRDLRRLANVILTPHVAGGTKEACARMAERALWNIELAEAGRFPEMDLLNPAVLAGKSRQS